MDITLRNRIFGLAATALGFAACGGSAVPAPARLKHIQLEIGMNAAAHATVGSACSEGAVDFWIEAPKLLTGCGFERKGEAQFVIRKGRRWESWGQTPNLLDINRGRGNCPTNWESVPRIQDWTNAVNPCRNFSSCFFTASSFILPCSSKTASARETIRRPPNQGFVPSVRSTGSHAF